MRFEFGSNWARFILEIDERRIDIAQRSLLKFLGVDSLKGKRFLDVGSGSGLFSLAARRLGAKVHSFDLDSESVACAEALRWQFMGDDPLWKIEKASILDPIYLRKLTTFDVVYSWGVLHHTGAMWQALENVVPLVAEGGFLYIAIYNDQGRASQRWRRIKKLYNCLPPPLRWIVLWPAALRLWGPTLVRAAASGQVFQAIKEYSPAQRGMSIWRDVLDWVGGYPFEVAKPEQIFRFYRDRGFILMELSTCAGGHGCNEYLFHKPLDKAL